MTLVETRAIKHTRPPTTICSTCTVRLVRIAYQRRPWFRLVREPLKAGMLFMGWLHRVRPEDYAVPDPECGGCIRFTKQALKERSGLFRWMNARVNPRFDHILETIITPDELGDAQRHASERFSKPLGASSQ
ncbi:MAG: nitroreductase [Chloroflexi bacterium]|nr:nitroreductase [Chloroflexota bacterium]